MKATVAFDAGTSGSKVIASYQLGEYPFKQKEDYFVIQPWARELTKETYESMLEYAYGGIGLESSLVSYLEPSSQKKVYWEVGESASRPGTLVVRERKFEKLLAKVLAFLGYLVKTQMQTEELVQLRLGILLPMDEFQDRRLLANWLRAIMVEGKEGGEEKEGFEVNGIKLTNIQLGSIDCKPEGFGIYKEYPSSQAGVLVIGHSDSSWLLFNNGLLNSKLSQTLPETGMHDFLRTVNLKFPITEELKAAEVIGKAGSNLNPKVLAELTQTKTEEEISWLISAIKDAKVQYWQEKRKSFSNLDIGGVGSISVSGGTANHFTEELNQLFKEMFGSKLNWCKSLMKEFSQRFNLKRTSKLGSRFADDYGYYKTLPGTVSYEPVGLVGGQKSA